MKICRKCLMMDTRPRLHFNENGICAACEWNEIKKKEIDWEKRYKELKNLCETIRGKQQYDCIVPVSGGKDSTYVADKMKNEFGLNVLTVTIAPPLETTLIQNNLENFLEHGYDHIKVTPNPVIAQEINKRAFVEQGRPLLSFTSCVQAVMFRFAVDFKIPLIMFGEEGETEYGGSTEMRYVPYYDVDYAIKVYMEGNNLKNLLGGKYSEREMSFWTFPDKEKMRETGFKVGHWSYYEDWDPYKHYEFARDHYGMQISNGRNVGTYTDFGQLDTPIYELHTYMMYLKFGFGRANQDACIDIRKGRLSREDAIEIVNKFDGEYPKESIPLFLDYFKMSKEEFDAVLDRHANKELFEKVNGIWAPKFTIE
ncbi:MAG TPA: N-acetyl sugar amidotransferase [Lachnospiraceae bacterium]|nr:N-acetyl sugar amidotransferase [Lachnospiraceae bacterium]